MDSLAKMIEKEDIHVKGKLTYKINGKLNHVYRIDILNELCTCYNWIKSHMPCHHIFALIHHNLITWDYLLKSYRERNYYRCLELICKFKQIQSRYILLIYKSLYSK